MTVIGILNTCILATGVGLSLAVMDFQTTFAYFMATFWCAAYYMTRPTTKIKCMNPLTEEVLADYFEHENTNPTATEQRDFMIATIKKVLDRAE